MSTFSGDVTASALPEVREAAAAAAAVAVRSAVTFVERCGITIRSSLSSLPLPDVTDDRFSTPAAAAVLITERSAGVGDDKSRGLAFGDVIIGVFSAADDAGKEKESVHSETNVTTTIDDDYN